MSTHTPGPWTYQQIDHGHKTATIETRTSNPILRLHGASAEGWADFEANARLIAAAPEMLEALKRLAHVPCEYQQGAHCTMIPDRRPCPPCAIRAAIAKAEGRDK